MKRLVYSPKVYAYIKSDSGIIDVTDYIVSGNVTRRVSAVSTAELTLRNPKFRFTKIEMCDDADCTSKSVQPVFHPMDPIVIILERLDGYPIQVFTGYLDTTPYLQLFPGTCTLKASCSLKRLMYTYFNPALASTIELMHTAGFDIATTGGMYFNSKKDTSANTALPPGQSTVSGQTIKKKSQSETDGGFSKLLTTVLTQIGTWDPKTIHIEALPPDIVSLVANIYSKLQTEADAQASEFRTFISDLIGQGNNAIGGSAGSGSAGGASGAVAGDCPIFAVVDPIARKYNIPVELMLGVMYIETSLTGHDTGGNPHYGWYQMQTANPPYAHGPFSRRVPTMAEAHDLGISSDAFAAAAAGIGGPRSDLLQWAMAVQGVNCGNNPYYCSGWGAAMARANAIKAKCANAPKPTNSGTTTNPASKAVNANPGPAPKSASNTYVFPVGKGFAWNRTDQGQDFTGAGAAVFAMGNATVESVGLWNGWPGSGGIVYRLKDGPRAGSLVYAQEDIKIDPSLHRGSVLTAGQQIGTIGGSASYGGGVSGIEMGWANASGTNALAHDHPLPASHYSAEGQDFHDVVKALSTGGQVPGAPGSGSAGAAGGGSTGGGSGTVANALQIAKATAFATLIQGPTLEQQAEAEMLGGRKSLMNDQPLLPFIQQLSQACLREFMSLPNGDFIAFYPDYFGGLNRQPYWDIYNIEILDGGLQISDDALCTHLFVIGDLIPFASGNFYANIYNEVASTGTISIEDAFSADFINGTYDKKANTSIGRGGQAKMGLDLSKEADAIAFLRKYGPRPKKLDAPFIRAPFYETFYAYQQFCLLWAEQFKSSFRFTFMPELYPGGLVALPEHGLQFYVGEVMHQFDYERGFETNALLMAPAAMLQSDGSPVQADKVNINQGLVRAGAFDPVAANLKKPKPKKKKK